MGKEKKREMKAEGALAAAEKGPTEGEGKAGKAGKAVGEAEEARKEKRQKTEA